VARILLVDDEQDIRDMFAQALTRAGHKVEVAASAKEAMELATKRTFDVAVIDFVLPGKRGLDLLQELRKSRPFLRSVIISGQIDHDVLDASDLEKQLKDRIAADRYLPKPTRFEDLQAAIEELMAPSTKGDWKELAANAAAAQSVRSKEVKDMDRAMRKARKRPDK
jgi:DNA-binding NtrC family response regulator